mmetsp:Transcript_22099/g.46991  ORF Transcript_22099/g.46991 Transcript_22099/m.46991 type:complete len:303 (-) Transcript_22099:143-1051(-)
MVLNGDAALWRASRVSRRLVLLPRPTWFTRSILERDLCLGLFLCLGIPRRTLEPRDALTASRARPWILGNRAEHGIASAGQGSRRRRRCHCGGSHRWGGLSVARPWAQSFVALLVVHRHLEGLKPIGLVAEPVVVLENTACHRPHDLCIASVAILRRVAMLRAEAKKAISMSRCMDGLCPHLATAPWAVLDASASSSVGTQHLAVLERFDALMEHIIPETAVAGCDAAADAVGTSIHGLEFLPQCRRGLIRKAMKPFGGDGGPNLPRPHLASALFAVVLNAFADRGVHAVNLAISKRRCLLV